MAIGDKLPEQEVEIKGGKYVMLAAIKDTLISVMPIVLFLLFFNFVILKGRLTNPKQTAVGILLTIAGMTLFVKGLELGLLPLGEDVGRTLPQNASVWVSLIFAFIVGYGVTLAEPALQALGMQVEELSAGVLKKHLVVHTVALGVGIGLLGGMLKIIFHIPTKYIVIPTYLVIAVLTYFAPDTITGIAFDSGGVTTGPVTVPITMALGVGMAMALGGRDPLADGFGLIALSSAGPIITVLLLGMIFRL